MNLNDVKIVGNLVRAPELRYTPQGTPVVNASLGVNEPYVVDGEKKQSTAFIEVQVWGKAAENLSKLAQKGQQLFVSGALRQDVWEKNGENHSKIYVRADQWQFVQYRSSEDERQAERDAQREASEARGRG
ncbi:MAG: single-stranded DNA-binding protein [Verrucomicrobia bacterium]|nr:single-stranded DNA-binding protein [Verrucomicrobiota bacterium]MBV8378963.1 single-stranded DNA-binding protein [Verrucomicrobiota bacterium]